MAEDTRTTWASEQWVIDRLVEAVDVGDAGAKMKLGTCLLDGYERHDWYRRRMVDSGALVLHEDLNPEVADPDDVAEVLGYDSDRANEIARGAGFTTQELEAWRALVVASGFDHELIYLGYANACVVVEVKHSDGRHACIAVQKWSRGSGVFVAAYKTHAEALNALRSIGMVKMDLGLEFEDQNNRDFR
jgi:hypothetical protein